MPGGAGSGPANGAATAGKTVPRRRGVRRDCDRVSKAEDVPEYKGTLPVEELLAFVEGSVVSSPGTARIPSTATADTKLRRAKRKEPLPIEEDLRLRNGDSSKLVEVSCLPHTEPLSGLLNGTSKPPHELVSELSENGWLPPELASHLMMKEDHIDDGVIERKEKEFVLVQKKRRPKIAAAMNGDPKQLLGGFCFSHNGVENIGDDGRDVGDYMNGFGMEVNGSAVTRNSSDDSLAQSFGSDIDDLSHFIGEDGQSGCELYVDAPLCWSNGDEDDDQDDSLSSFCSTMSFTESHQRLNSPPSSKVESSPDINQVDVVPRDQLDLPADRLPDNGISATDEESSLANSRMTVVSQRLKTDSCNPSSMLCTDRVRRCTRLCCVVPYRHVKHQSPVMFCDSRPVHTGDDLSAILFSFGCTLSDHLVDGGLCIDAKCAAECELDSARHLCSELPAVDDSPSVSFMYSDIVDEQSSSSVSCVQPSLNSSQTCSSDALSNTGCIQRFEIHDVQSYMYTSK